MRFYTIYRLCRDNMEGLDQCFTGYNFEGGTPVLSVHKWNAARVAMQNLYAVKAFRDIILKIYNDVPVLYRERDNWDKNSKNDLFVSNLSALKYMVFGIVAVYESFGYEQGGMGIDVKMPDGDFTDFSANVKDLEYVVDQCPLLRRDDGEVRFNRVDLGSTWLTFLIVGTRAVALAKSIAALVDKAIVIKSHWNQTRQQEQLLRTMELANEELETVVAAYKKIDKAVMEKALKELGEKCGGYENEEERDKTRLALEKLIELLDKGMEIYSSIDSPKEIQTLFPPLETEKLVESEETKLLTEKEEE